MQDPNTGELRPVRNQAELAEAVAKNWPVFEVGEVIEIKGGRFRVKSFGRKELHLEGLPGTRLEHGPAPNTASYEGQRRR